MLAVKKKCDLLRERALERESKREREREQVVVDAKRSFLLSFTSQFTREREREV